MEMTNVAFEQGRVDGGGPAVDRALLDHPHVNREYRRLFGAPPRQDAARLRVGR